MKIKKILAGTARAAVPGTTEALTPERIRQAFQTYGLTVEGANLEQYETAPEGVLVVRFNLMGAAKDIDLSFDLPDIMAEISTKLGADNFNSLRTNPYSVTFVFDEGGLTWGSLRVVRRTGSFESEYLKQVMQELAQHVDRRAFTGIYAHGTAGVGAKNWEVFVPKNQWFSKGLYIHVGDAENATDAKAQALETVARHYEQQDLDFISDGRIL